MYVNLQMTQLSWFDLLFSLDTDLKRALQKLENSSELAISWFETNHMKLNIDKCHLLISGTKQNQTSRLT